MYKRQSLGLSRFEATLYLPFWFLKFFGSLICLLSGLLLFNSLFLSRKEASSTLLAVVCFLILSLDDSFLSVEDDLLNNLSSVRRDVFWLARGLEPRLISLLLFLLSPKLLLLDPISVSSENRFLFCKSRTFNFSFVEIAFLLLTVSYTHLTLPTTVRV